MARARALSLPERGLITPGRLKDPRAIDEEVRPRDECADVSPLVVSANHRMWRPIKDRPLVRVLSMAIKLVLDLTAIV